MFFIASKLIWPLLAPLNFIMILMILGAVTMALFRRAGQVILAGAMGLFFIFGLVPVGQWMMAGLENQYSQPFRPPPTVDGIIVLGGSFEMPPAARPDILVINDSSERILEGVRLANRYPEARLLFTGGEARIAPKGHPESADVRNFIENYMSLPLDRVVFESQSRNTYENMILSSSLVQPRAGQRWILVTSAFHMPRAMAVFQSAGWPGLIPWPVDYRTDGVGNIMPRKLDVGGNFYKLDMALREYIGMISYTLTGKISKTGGKTASAS